MQRWRNALSVDQVVSSKARRAAAIASSMSSWPASATGPSTSSVAGLMLSKVLPDLASTSFPSISMRCSPRVVVLVMDSLPLRPFGRLRAVLAALHCG